MAEPKDPKNMDDRELRQALDECDFDCPQYEAILAVIEERNLDI